MATHGSKWGAKIGPRLAILMAQGVIYCHQRLVAVKHKLAMAVFHAISDEISEEVDTTLGPLIARLHNETPEDHPAYAAIHFLHTATGQLKALAGTGLQVSGLLGAVAAVMNNDLLPAVYNLVNQNPNSIPDAGTVAELYAANQISYDYAISSLAKLGFEQSWADPMLNIARSWPDIATSAELFRRNLISHDEFVSYLEGNGIPSGIAAKLSSLWEIPVSAADAALAVLRGNMSQAEGERIAYANGVTAESFSILIGNTGEPPGLMQLLEGFRRGFIDQATLQRGILQSRYRDEWIPLLEKLRYEPMSVADAVNAVVQNHMTMAEGSAISEQNGLEPGAFQTLYETAGEPLSRTEMEDLYNRGLATEDDVIQALRESRLKNKYNQLAFDLHRRIIPITTLQRALRYGGVSHPDAVKIAMESGYSETDATMLVNAGVSERLQTYKDRVVSAVQSLYEDNIISQNDAQSITEGMNFSKDEAKFILESSEFRRQAKVLNQVVGAIKGKYLAHHITRNQAIGFIDTAGIPSQQRDFLLKLWDIEHGAYVRPLTEAQVLKAVKLQLITPEEGKTRLENMGYVAGDAQLLIDGA